MPDCLRNVVNYLNIPLSPLKFVWNSVENIRLYCNLVKELNVYWLLLMLLWFMSMLNGAAARIFEAPPCVEMSAMMEVLEVSVAIKRNELTMHRAW